MSRTLPGIIAALVILSAPAIEASPTVWRDTPRDVYVDGSLDRPAQILFADAPRRLAIFSDRFEEAVVLDLDAGKAFTSKRSRWSFAADRMSATTEDELKPRRVEDLHSTKSGIQMTKIGRHSITLTSHHSTAGPMSEETLFRDFPAWEAASRAYQPDPASVDALKKISEPTTVRIVMATWCGDSRASVPKVLETIREAANPMITTEIIGVGPDFDDPLGFIQKNRIINVPTVIVEKDSVELGRITETPATASVERDLAAIVDGTLPAHPGRIARTALLASGSYRIESATGDGEAVEDWEIFSTPSGGRLVHSVILRGKDVREIWQTLDRDGRTSFVELTDRTGSTTRRTRFRVGKEGVTAHSRGNTSGIIEQVTHLPGPFSFDTTALASLGFGLEQLRDLGRALDCYTIGDCGSTGQVTSLTINAVEEEFVDAGFGLRRANVYQSEGESLWVDAISGIALRRDAADGSRATLTGFVLY